MIVATKELYGGGNFLVSNSDLACRKYPKKVQSYEAVNPSQTNVIFKILRLGLFSPVPSRKKGSINRSPLFSRCSMNTLELLMGGGSRGSGTCRQNTRPRSGTLLEQLHSGLNTQGGYCTVSALLGAPCTAARSARVKPSFICKYQYTWQWDGLWTAVLILQFNFIPALTLSANVNMSYS